jgi:hypothetical protein
VAFVLAEPAAGARMRRRARLRQVGVTGGLQGRKGVRIVVGGAGGPRCAAP